MLKCHQYNSLFRDVRGHAFFRGGGEKCKPSLGPDTQALAAGQWEPGPRFLAPPTSRQTQGRGQLPHTRSALGATGRTRPAAPPEPGRGRPPPSRQPGCLSRGISPPSRPRPQEASPGSSRPRGLPRQDGLSLYPGRVQREGAALSSALPLF